MKKSHVRRKISELEDRAIETQFARSVMHKIKRNKLFQLIQSETERIKAKKMMEEIKQHEVPRHLAIIMDGNRRYALYEGMDVRQGHKIGGDKLEEVVGWCHEVGIEGLTVFAFSTDNFKRPKEEVDHLMDLFEKDLNKLAEDKRTHENEVRIRVIGQIEKLPERVVKAAQKVMEATKNYKKHYFNIAIGYGGREEIVEAVKKIAQAVKEGRIKLEDIKKDMISSYLYTSDSPDPDLILRTSGEERISNFLLWQLAYSELYFTDIYWPVLKKTDFLEVIRSYQRRQRRYGK